MRRRAYALGLVFVVALTARTALTIALFDAEQPPFAYEHGEIAKNLLAGRGFAVRFLGADGPTSQQAPLYPALVAGAYWLFGANAWALLSIQLLQCLAGASTAALLTWLVWALMPARTGIGVCAGLVAALHPAQIYAVTHIQVVVWATLLLIIALSVAASGRGVGGRTIWAGVASGLLLLVEPIYLLLLPSIAWLSARPNEQRAARGDFRRVLRPALWFSVTVLAVIAPWLWRNYRVHGELVFVKSTFGYAFWQGNNSRSWGTDKLPKSAAEPPRRAHDGSLRSFHQALWNARHETIYIDDALLTRADYQQLAALNEPARSRRLAARAWSELDPRRYAELCWRRARYFLLFDATNPKAANVVYQVATVSWLSLAIVGWVWLGSDRRRFRLLAGIFGIALLFHVLTITAPRFRIPVEVLTYAYAAVPLAAIWSRFQQRWSDHFSGATREARTFQLPAQRAA